MPAVIKGVPATGQERPGVVDLRRPRAWGCRLVLKHTFRNASPASPDAVVATARSTQSDARCWPVNVRDRTHRPGILIPLGGVRDIDKPSTGLRRTFFGKDRPALPNSIIRSRCRSAARTGDGVCALSMAAKKSNCQPPNGRCGTCFWPLAVTSLAAPGGYSPPGGGVADRDAHAT